MCKIKKIPKWVKKMPDEIRAGIKHGDYWFEMCHSDWFAISIHVYKSVVHKFGANPKQIYFEEKRRMKNE